MSNNEHVFTKAEDLFTDKAKEEYMKLIENNIEELTVTVLFDRSHIDTSFIPRRFKDTTGDFPVTMQMNIRELRKILITSTKVGSDTDKINEHILDNILDAQTLMLNKFCILH